MKFPKNRANLYLVVREVDEVVCGAFSEPDSADDYVGACAQDWLEKVPDDPQKFVVRLTTFYG